MWGIYIGDGVHVIAVSEYSLHEQTVDCVCEPEIEWCDPDTGMPYSEGPLVIHDTL